MKSVIITILLFIVHFSSWSQTSITTDGPCTDLMAQNEKGRWIKSTDIGAYNSKETNSRLDEIHKMILGIYPQPTGIDATWHRSAGVSYFGTRRKYDNRADENNSFDYLDLPHFVQYTYTAGFFRYYCEYNKTHSLQRGHPGETGTWINITANTNLAAIATDDTWTINGLPVILLKPVHNDNDGIKNLFAEPGARSRQVIVHRRGASPFLPVSRKQYLDYCITYHTNLWNNVIRGLEQMPVRSAAEQENEKKTTIARFEKNFSSDPKKLKATVDYYLSGYKTDQQIRDEKVSNARNNKEKEIKKFTDELEKAGLDGSLGSQAMVLVQYLSSPVFETDPAKGLMLVTENPAYIRKDLPKYAPQFFLVTWTSNEWIKQKQIGELMEQKFPFDKLQAMIDK